MAFNNGPDPNFPYLGEDARFPFPPPEKASHDGIIAFGGNLSPGMLLSAYEQGHFPWYNEGDPIIWQSPDPRFVIFPQNLHVSSSMKKILKQKRFTVAFDRDFPTVIAACAKTRPGQEGTWITKDMIDAYTKLHHLGWAHSSEAYLDGELVGGCYGIRLGNIFFGESMFKLVPNASKAAFLTIARILFDDGVQLIDCQQPTSHLESLGGEVIARKDFIVLLRKIVEERLKGDSDALDRRGSWEQLAPG